MIEPFAYGYLALLFTTPLVNLFLHAFVVRIMRRFKKNISSQVAAILSILAGYPIVGFAVWWIYLHRLHGNIEQLFSGVYAALVYSCLSYAYFHLFNMSETARRFRIAYEIKRRGSMTRAEINEFYKPDDMLTVRLERLVAMKQLKRTGDRLVLEGRLLYFIAKILMKWARVLGFPLETIR